MSTDKTLADVKPGGRVRLGDALPPLPTEVDAVRCMIRGEKDLAEACDYYYTAEQMRDYARAALSAQPSPGGQGDVLDLDRVLSLADVHAEESREDGVRLLDRGGLLALAQDVAAVLAARQPVGEPVAYLDLGAGGYMDVGTDLSDEELAALPKGRHMLGIIGTYGVDGYKPAQEVGEPVAYWLAVDKDGIVEFGMSADDGNEGQAARQEVNDFINGALHDGGVPHRLVGVYAAPPAQAVDLDAMHAAACAAWNKHQEACRITTVTGALRKVCEALLDIQAVGNGN